MVLKEPSIKRIYNLEFPRWCQSMTICDYKFYRIDDYKEKLQNLQHFKNVFSEFEIRANTGKHAITAYVELPEKEKENKAILEWSDTNSSALNDILLLLSIFTFRDVFAVEASFDDNNSLISADLRLFLWGNLLRSSIPYIKKVLSDEPQISYNIGFEEGINKIYDLMKSEEWQKKYNRGYFLFLAKQAFKNQILEASFIQCWTIWEHLFTILNRSWLSSDKIEKLATLEKISYLLVEYGLTDEVTKSDKEQIKKLAKIRNRLIHYGRFPEQNSVIKDTILFIKLTESIIAKILGLIPSNVLNTKEDFEIFLKNKGGNKHSKGNSTRLG
jgi:hypothetical protein